MSWLFIILITIGLTHAAVGAIIIARERRRFRNLGQAHEPLPAVSVLKPIKGVDSDLAANLRTFFAQDYPRYEIIFAIRDLDDPAIDVVRAVRREFPNVRSQLIVNDRDIGFNPKVNNLHHAMQYASHDVIVVSDSNVRVGADYLTHLVSELSGPRVELVTSIIRGVGGSGLGSLFENIHLNGFISGAVYTVSRIFRVPVTIGKSMCFRRRLLESFGGWKAFSNYLIEDAILGREVDRNDFKIAHCFYQIENVNKQWSVVDFISRHLRWGIMRRYLSLPNFIAEIAGNPIFAATFLTILYPGRETGTLWFGVAAFKILMDFSAARLIGDKLPWYSFLLVPLKDMIIGAIWIMSFFRRTVNWRGNRIRIGQDTLISDLNGHSGRTSDAGAGIDWGESLNEA